MNFTLWNPSLTLSTLLNNVKKIIITFNRINLIWFQVWLKKMIIWNKSFGKINKTKKMWEKNDNKKIWFFHIVRCLVRLLNSFVSDMIGILILKLFSVLLLLFNKMYTLKSVMFIHSFIHFTISFKLFYFICQIFSFIFILQTQTHTQIWL